MLVVNHQSHNPLSGHLGLNVHGNNLNVGNDTKYLSVYVDSNLNWKKHVNETSRTVSRAFRTLKQAKKRFLLKPSKTYKPES